MLLIYVQKITPRVSYTFKQICKRILGLEINFTSKIEIFIAHDGPKFSYGKQPLGKELYFQCVNLLFEEGLNDIEIEVLPWEDTTCFFQVKHDEAALPFDIFAATFYLLTRYEEYHPHVKDDLGRFVAANSIGYIHGFLEDPVVDIWAYKFKKNLQRKYPNIVFGKRKFTVVPMVSVRQTFKYKQKGILRYAGGILRDLWQLQINQLGHRFRVSMGIKKDPYDTFDFLIDLQKKKKRKLIVMFSLGDLSKYEKNIRHNSPIHQSLIKHVADYTDVGLRVSYEAVCNLSLLKKEKQRIENIVNRQLRYSLCAFYKIKLPVAYRNFIELEIKEDFSMGYSRYSGFRAGTCTPFLFYDLDYEVQTPLVINSFCFTSESFKTIKNEVEVRKAVVAYVEKIRSVEGTFIPVFNNELFSEYNNHTYWKSILEYIWNLKDEK